MRRKTTMFGLAVLLTACGGGAALAPVVPHATHTCRPTDAVAWVWAAPAAERAQQDAWCAAVGAPVVHRVDGAARLDSLAVVTWNVKVGGGDVFELVQRLRHGAFTGGRPVEHFALLLQEVHRGGSAVPARHAGMKVPRGIRMEPPAGERTAIDVLARELGLSLAYVPSMRNGTTADAEDRGNAILTTLPLGDVVAIELPLVRQRRVAVAATLAGHTTSGVPWRLQLASVHLENRPARGITGVSERAEQMTRLLAALAPAGLSVLGGDLNTWVGGGDEPAVSLALDAYPETGPTHEHITLNGPAFFDVRLDYLFARAGRLSGYRRIDGRYGSDHYPVLAWVQLAGTTITDR